MSPGPKKDSDARAAGLKSVHCFMACTLRDTGKETWTGISLEGGERRRCISEGGGQGEEVFDHRGHLADHRHGDLRPLGDFTFLSSLRLRLTLSYSGNQ